MTMASLGCSEKTNYVAAKELSTFNVNMYSLNKLVCDPFDGGPSNPTNPDFGRGLKASLYYLRDDQPRYGAVLDYINLGVKADQFLFFTKLDVPTRKFNIGFPTESGSLVKRDDGTDLLEYFALRLSTVLHLGPNDEEGAYELAILSDDGAVWRLRGADGNYQTVVSNDGNHPTKMGCTTYELSMTKATEKLMQFDYYQGPRFHISVIPMWRKKVPGQVAEPLCNQMGNNLFFDENTSLPKQPYNDLLARGWKPLNSTNYSLPASAIFNPCEQGTIPQVGGLIIEDLGNGHVVARWETDIPTASQVKIVDVASGVEQLTESDNEFRTQQEVLMSGLKPGRQYTFQGISISSDYGKALTNSVTITLH